jgi:16S rRNA (guanine(966)-N(2))-methyltransferase RsmD
MRVIGGEFRSRCLKSVPGMATRPTPDRLRQALFNVLTPRLAGCTFLDAYAGCGAVGIEALSRGASRVILIEKNLPAIRVIEENLKALGIRDAASLVRGAVLAHLARLQADIVFLDPPYDLVSEYEQVLGLLGRNPPASVIAQHTVRLKLEEAYGGLRLARMLKQGDNVLSFFEPGV